MDELTNQVEEEVDYLLPDDYEESNESEEESEEVTEEVSVDTEESEVEEEQEEGTEEEEDTTESLEELEIKYLKDIKKLKDIPKDELQTYIQKGMNHDRLQEKLTASNDQNNEFTEVAKMFDMETEQLMEALKQQYFDNKAKTEERNVEDVKKEYNANRKDLKQKMIDRFVDKFPDVDVSNLPQEVMDATASGEDLVTAYEMHNKDNTIAEKETEITKLNEKIAEYEKKLKIKSQNAKVKKKGVVKHTGGSDDAKNDDFLTGLFGE